LTDSMYFLDKWKYIQTGHNASLYTTILALRRLKPWNRNSVRNFTENLPV
jgi:hypothetical protein